MSTSKNQTQFQRSLYKWAAKNFSDGFPHLNHMGWCYAVAKNHWPDAARQFHSALMRLKADDFSPEATREFLSAWKVICKRVREWHLIWVDTSEKRGSGASGR